MPPIIPKKSIDFEVLVASGLKKDAFVTMAARDAKDFNINLALDQRSSLDYLAEVFNLFEYNIRVSNPELDSLIATDPRLFEIFSLGSSVKNVDTYLKYYENSFQNGVLNGRAMNSGIGLKGNLLGIGPKAELNIRTFANSPIGQNPFTILKENLEEINETVDNLISRLRFAPPPNNITNQQAALIKSRFQNSSKELLENVYDTSQKISQIVSQKQNYLKNREQLYQVMQRKQRDDYYSQVVSNQGTSDALLADPKNEQRVRDSIKKRHDLYEDKIAELEKLTGSTIVDIVSLQEKFVFPSYAIRELRSKNSLDANTVRRLREYNDRVVKNDVYVENTTSVLSSDQLPPSKKPRNWQEFNASEVNGQVNPPTAFKGKLLNDKGNVGSDFDSEYVSMVWDDIENYKKRSIEADKKRIEIAGELYKKNYSGASPRPVKDAYIDMPFFGSWTIADEIKRYIEDGTIDKKDRAKMKEEKKKLATLLAGNGKVPPLLLEGIRLQSQLKAIGYDDVKFDFSDVSDGTPTERQIAGDKRAAIIAPMQSATSQRQIYGTIGRQTISNPDSVSQFAFHVGDSDTGNLQEAMLPSGELGKIVEEVIDRIQLPISTPDGSKEVFLRSNTGFINKEVWNEVVSNPIYANQKQDIEIALRADMYRNMSEKNLKPSWDTHFENSYLSELSRDPRYIGLSRDQLRDVVNGEDLENVRNGYRNGKRNFKNQPRDLNGNNLGEAFTNLQYLSKLTLESMSREYGKQIASLQQTLSFSTGTRDISRLDVTLLYREAYRRFTGGFVTSAGLATELDKNNLEIIHQVEAYKNQSNDIPGYFLGLRMLNSQDLNIALRIGQQNGVRILTGLDTVNLQKIMPISNLDVLLEIERNTAPGGVSYIEPVIRYKENRAVDFAGDASHSSMMLRGNPNVIKVYKELLAHETPSPDQVALLGELEASMSTEMIKLVKDEVGKIVQDGKGGWILQTSLEKKNRDKYIGGLAKDSDTDFKNWYKSWLIPGAVGADASIDALVGTRSQKWANANVFNPEQMIHTILTDRGQGFGWGKQFVEDFQSWTFGGKSPIIDPSRFINPFTKDKSKDKNEQTLTSRDTTGWGKGLQGIDNWKTLLDGSRKDGGLWGHFMKTGKFPGLEIPFTNKVILGNIITQPFIGGDAEGKEYKPGDAGINILTDITGRSALKPADWVSFRLQYMVGLRKLENGQEISTMGSYFTKKWNSWENGLDSLVDSNFGKALKLDKRNKFEKRAKQNFIKEIASLAFNIVEGSVEYVLVGAGKVALATPVLGSALKYVGERPAFVAAVDGVSGTFGALKASIPIARAVSVGAFNTGLIGLPVYFIAGGGLPGIIFGTGLGGLWGANAGLNALASQDVLKSIETFMGFERLENPALMQSALVNMGENPLIARTFAADGRTIISGIRNNTELFQQGLKWENLALKEAGYVRWLSPHGWYGKFLTRVYNFVGGEEKAFDNMLLAPYAGSGSGLELAKNIVGATARGALVGAGLYLWTGNPLIAIGGLAGFGAVEYAARAAMPAIAVKLQFLGETAAGARIANALTRINYVRVAFPLLDTIGLVQTTDFFNQALAIPTYQMLRGAVPVDVWAFGGTARINLWNISLGEAKAYGITEPEYYAALRKSEQTGLIPMHTFYYDGVFSGAMLSRVAFNIGLGYIPLASAFSSRIFVLAEKLGVKSIWGTWYANRFATLPDSSILSRLKLGRFKILGDAIDRPFGRFGGTIAKVGGTALGAFGGFELAIYLGITNPVGIAAMTLAGAGVGYGAASLLSRAGGFFYDNVLTGWLRTPLAAGGGFVSLVAPLLGGAIGGLVAQIGGFGTGGYIAATIAGTIVGAIIIPGVGGILGFAIGAAASAVAGYGAAFVGDWIGNWWNKTTGFALDALKNISPVLGIIRLFKALDDADLGRFIGAVIQFAMSFSVGMVTVGAVVSFIPPIISPAAVASAGTGGFFLPVGKLTDKTFVGYDKAKNVLKYTLNVNPAVVGIYNDTATITAVDNPDDAATITLVTNVADSVCAGTADQFEISGKTIKLKDINFDKARMQKSICVDYLVTPTKTLADYTQFCNTVQSTAIPGEPNTSGKEVLGGEQYVQCVSNKGVSLGTKDLNDLEGQDNQTPDSGGTVPNTWGTGGFPVDPKLPGVVGVQCSFSGGTHSVIGALDIVAPLGTPIYAWADGKVIAAGTFEKYVSSVNGYYGQMIMILHANNVVTWYAHLDSMAVKVGDEVKQGQPIGRMGHSVGNSNCSMGVHLHWEIRLYDQSVTKDPCNSMIDCSQYNGTPACFQPGYNSSRTGAVVSSKWFIDNLGTGNSTAKTCNINTYKGT